MFEISFAWNKDICPCTKESGWSFQGPRRRVLPGMMSSVQHFKIRACMDVQVARMVKELKNEPLGEYIKKMRHTAGKEKGSESSSICERLGDWGREKKPICFVIAPERGEERLLQLKQSSNFHCVGKWELMSSLSGKAVKDSLGGQLIITIQRILHAVKSEMRCNLMSLDTIRLYDCVT